MMAQRKDWSGEEQWVVVSTRPGCEHLAKHEAKRLGYDAYLPLVSQPPKFEPKPFFPGYLFVDIEPRLGMWRPLNAAKGVTSILRTGEHPSKVPPKLIDIMRRREEGGVITIKAKPKASAFQAGQDIRVSEGAFEGLEGVFTEARPQDRVIILLSICGRQTPVELAAEQIIAKKASKG